MLVLVLALAWMLRLGGSNKEEGFRSKCWGNGNSSFGLGLGVRLVELGLLVLLLLCNEGRSSIMMMPIQRFTDCGDGRQNGDSPIVTKTFSSETGVVTNTVALERCIQKHAQNVRTWDLHSSFPNECGSEYVLKSHWYRNWKMTKFGACSLRTPGIID